MSMSIAPSNPLVWTSVPIIGYYVPVYGFSLLVALLGILCMQDFLDFLTGHIACRKNIAFRSKIGFEGILKKGILIIVLFALISGAGAVKSAGIDNIFVQYIPFGFLIIFNYNAFVSILENLSVIYSDDNNGKVFKFLSNISQFLFNVSLDKLKEVSEKEILKKINK